MDWSAELDKQVSAYLPDLTMRREEPMRLHTSFRVGGPAARMAFPTSGEQLVLLLDIAATCGARPYVMGNGTNVLVADGGLDRLVVNTTALRKVEFGPDHTVTAEAGITLARLADSACKQGLSGLEFAHGIPGTLGGAVCMNAGAYDGEMRLVVRAVTALFPEEGIRILNADGLEFGYRHSVFSDRPEGVCLRATLALTPGDTTEIRGKMDTFMARRKASQPLELPSAGSTFKRPKDHYAGALIEQCGLKGLTVGGAQVSEKHAGFVVNRGGATAADIRALIEEVQRRVQGETGVALEPEVRFLDA